ncbi:MAG TPA: hypothetical protein VGJ54_16240 [Streptosporangiaceae bacterium]|jgi:hypothetical protein
MMQLTALRGYHRLGRSQLNQRGGCSPLRRRVHVHVAESQTHAGLILVSGRIFPQDRTFTAAIISALSVLLDQPSQIQPGQVLFLPRR